MVYFMQMGYERNGLIIYSTAIHAFAVYVNWIQMLVMMLINIYISEKMQILKRQNFESNCE